MLRALDSMIRLWVMLMKLSIVFHGKCMVLGEGVETQQGSVQEFIKKFSIDTNGA